MRENTKRSVQALRTGQFQKGQDTTTAMAYLKHARSLFESGHHLPALMKVERCLERLPDLVEAQRLKTAVLAKLRKPRQ